MSPMLLMSLRLKQNFFSLLFLFFWNWVLLSIKLVSMIYLFPEEAVRIKLRFFIYKTHRKKQYLMINPFLLSHVFALAPYLVCDMCLKNILIFQYFPFALQTEAQNNYFSLKALLVQSNTYLHSKFQVKATSCSVTWGTHIHSSNGACIHNYFL